MNPSKRRKFEQKKKAPAPTDESDDETFDNASAEQASASDNDDESDSVGDEGDDELSATKKALASIPFGQLLALRKSGVPSKRPAKETVEEQVKENKKRKKEHKAKNAPAEMSSKIPVGRLRMVAPSKKAPARDPRFDPSIGQFNEDAFRKSYGFVKDIQQKEVEDLRQRLKREKDPEEKEKIEKALTIFAQQRRARDEKEKQRRLKAKLRKEEASKVAKGKKPFYLKRADVRKAELVEKFQQLQSKPHALEKFVEKKLKKKAQKDRRHLPDQRRQTAS